MLSIEKLREDLYCKKFEKVTLNKSEVLDELMPLIVEKYQSRVSVADLTGWICENAFQVTERTIYRRIRIHLEAEKKKIQNKNRNNPFSAKAVPLSDKNNFFLKGVPLEDL